jgi:uncharacterized protein
MRTAFAGIIVAAASFWQSQAASFDCSKAATAIEKRICSDKELSDLDSQLGQSYKRLLAALDKEQQKILKESQKEWLASRNEGTDTLSTFYRERIAELDVKLRAVSAQAVSPFGRYTIEHSVAMFDGGTWTDSWSGDDYTVTVVDSQTVSISIAIVGTNAHECSIDGKAIRIGNGVYLWKGTEEAGLCTVKVTVFNNHIKIEPGQEEGCSYYCGARAGLQEIDLLPIYKVGD